MVGATESVPRESDSPRRAGLRCMLMSVDRVHVSVVDSRDDPVTWRYKGAQCFLPVPDPDKAFESSRLA